MTSGCFMWLMVSVVSVAFLYMQNAYDHYATVLLPLFVVAVCRLDGKSFAPPTAKLTDALCVLMCIFVLTSSVYKSYKAFVTEQPDHAYEYYGDDYDTLLAMLPVIILYLFAQKYIIQGMVDGAIK